MSVATRRFGIVVVSLLVSSCGGGGGSGVSTTETTTPPPPPPISLSASIDTLFSATMATYGITAATITIINKDSLLYEKGYGYQDAAQTIPLPANALMMTGSSIKPVASAAIQKLARDGILNLSDHVFCTGNNQPCWLPESLLPSPLPDTRVSDITIQQLISHTGGWDRDSKSCPQAASSGDCDPFASEGLVQSSLGLSGIAQKADIVRYWMQFPLDFTPGTKQVYSNFGYFLLGVIVEQATQTSFVSYASANIMAPLGVAADDFQGFDFTNPGLRMPNMITTVTCSSIYAPNTTVLFTQKGCYDPANWYSVGTMLTTSNALAKFAQAYRLDNSDPIHPGSPIYPGTSLDGPLDGVPLSGTTNDGMHGGNLPGTVTAVRQLPHGISYAFMMNNNVALPSGLEFTLYPQIDRIIAEAGY